MPVLTPSHEAAPPRSSGAFGRLCSQVLTAHFAGAGALVPAESLEALRTWLAEVLAGTDGLTIGLDPADLPATWQTALIWVGVPIAPGGSLTWGRDLAEDPGLALPCRQGDRLLVPNLDTLTSLHAPELKILRRWVADRLGCRLQAAPGIHLTLWPRRCLVISHRDEPLGGFVYGPDAGTRTSITLAPGACQTVLW